MKRDHEYIRRFEDDLAREEGRVGHARALEIFTRLWEEGRAIGTLPPDDPLDGLETKLRIARILNSCSSRS